MLRTTVLTAGALVATVAFVPSADAARRGRKRSRPQIVEVITPVGLQGVAGAGTNIVVGFVLVQRTRRACEVEAQYGRDVNLDAEISDDEFHPLTEDRLDARDTRGNTKPWRFPAATAPGAGNAIVWDCLADIGSDVYAGPEFALTPQGRPIPDPNNPDQFLLARGPDGTPGSFHVIVRLRPSIRRGRGDWVESTPIFVNNSHAPSMRIDTVAASAADPTVVLVDWTVFDADSEDLDGNGVLDIGDGEDRDGDLVLDDERIGVAFDYLRLSPGEDPSSLTDAQLASRFWQPCTRREDVGQTDSLFAPIFGPVSGGLASARAPFGRSWLFAWDSESDVGTLTDGIILRGTPVDQHRNHGPTVYSRTVVLRQP